MYTSSHLGRSSPAGSSSRNDTSSSAGTPERTPQIAKMQFRPTSERQRLNLLGRHASWIYRFIATLRSSARRASHLGRRTNHRVAQSQLSSCKRLRGDDCERRGVARWSPASSCSFAQTRQSMPGPIHYESSSNLIPRKSDRHFEANGF
jgi:hypothetical protein